MPPHDRFLDRQDSFSIWHAAHDGSEGSVIDADPGFCETLGQPEEEILERKRYHSVNPPGTSVETIAQNQVEDRQALGHGYFPSAVAWEMVWTSWS